MTTTDRAAKIAALNDALRKSPTDRRLGKTTMTDGVDALGPEKVAALIAQVTSFDAFSEDNDPYGEHDFGSVTLDGEKYFWKIDYYAKADPNMGSEDPSDEMVTERVLTLMRTDEY